jgi:hypothetical protein
MNRDQIRVQKRRAIEDLRKSKAFVLMFWDGRGLPRFKYDVSKCKNKDDLRHFVMQVTAVDAEDVLKIAVDALGENKKQHENAEKVAEFKKIRSDELAAAILKNDGSLDSLKKIETLTEPFKQVTPILGATA